MSQSIGQTKPVYQPFTSAEKFVRIVDTCDERLLYAPSFERFHGGSTRLAGASPSGVLRDCFPFQWTEPRFYNAR